MEAMLEHNALELLVQRLMALRDEKGDEAAAVFSTFNIFENMIEVKPEVAELLVQNTKVRAPTLESSGVCFQRRALYVL